MFKKLCFGLAVLGITTQVSAYEMTSYQMVYYWATKGFVEDLKTLVKTGYSLDMMDKNQHTPLCDAVYNNNAVAFRTLLLAGADSDVACLQSVPEQNRQEFLKVYRATSDEAVLKKTKNNSTLCDAISRKDKDVVQFLLKAGISTDSPCMKKVSPEKRIEMGIDKSEIQTQKPSPVLTNYPKNGVNVRPYLSLKGTYSKLNMDGTLSDAMKSYDTVKNDWVAGVSVAAGVKVGDFRGELEYNHSATAEGIRHAGNGLYDTIKGKQASRSYMFNGYYDIPTQTVLHPYVGAGIGIAQVKNSLTFVNTNETTKAEKTSFAYQLMAGAGYDLTPNWALDVGYRYKDNGETSWTIADEAGKVNFDAIEHQIMAGIRYTF